MHRIDTPNKATNLFGAGKHGWRDGNKVAGINATEFNAAFQNTTQEELAAIVEAAGLALDPANNGQVLLSIQKMIEARAGNFVLDTGVANAYVIALSPAIAAYTGNFMGSFAALNTNTGACTLNSGGGVVALVNDVGGALVAGDIPAGAIVSFLYEAADNRCYITSLVQSQGDARYAAIIAAKPTGEIYDFAGTTAPAGSLICPVAQTNISRATYAALFAVIGTTWGVGNGATTFGMPWFPADYALIQANANVGTSSVGSVIAHTHPSAAAATGMQVLSAGAAGAAINGTVTGSTGGAANLAAGVRVLKCVKY